MRRNCTAALTAALLIAGLVLALGGGAATGAPPPRAPAEFFGIGPQTPLTARDAEYMKAGGIGIVRMAVPWSSVQEKNKKGVYNWAGLDEGVGIAARAGLRVLPFLYGTPHWLAASRPRCRSTTPGSAPNGRRSSPPRCERYGPGGEFWAKHATGRRRPSSLRTDDRPLRSAGLPIRTWQIWNEANFFYFAYPASPSRYARLLVASSKAIKAADPGAKVILSGLFAKPTADVPEGDARRRVPRTDLPVPGDQEPLRRHRPAPLRDRHRDPRRIRRGIPRRDRRKPRSRAALHHRDGLGLAARLPRGRLRAGHRRARCASCAAPTAYLLENRTRLDVKQVYWFSWKDIQGDCNFCDSVGLFQEGPAFRPKPAWKAFVQISRGRLRP